MIDIAFQDAALFKVFQDGGNLVVDVRVVGGKDEQERGEKVEALQGEANLQQDVQGTMAMVKGRSATKCAFACKRALLNP